MILSAIIKYLTGWKVSKYGVFSALYFPVFGLNTEIYSVNLDIQSKYRKIRTRKNSAFGHFSRSIWYVLWMFRSLFITRLQTELQQTLNASTRIRRSQMLSKVCVFKKIAKFIGKHLCRSLFLNKVAGLEQFILQFLGNSLILQRLKETRNLSKMQPRLFLADFL